MPYFFIIAITLLITSCAKDADHYTQTVAGWRGAKVAELSAKWGRPDNILKASDGRLVYVYKTASYMKSPSQVGPNIDVRLGDGPDPLIVAMPNPNRTWSRGSTTLSCIAAFKADKSGIITGTKTYGTGCFNGKIIALNRPDSNVKV